MSDDAEHFELGVYHFTKVRFTKVSFHKKFISQKIYKVLFIDKLINYYL